MKSKSARDYKELLRSGKWFHGLDDDVQNALLELATVQTLAPNARVFSMGDASNGLWGIVDGVVRVTTPAPDGSEILLTLAERPQWLGEIAVFDGQTRSHDATASSDVIAIHVSQARLDEWLARDPRVWRSLSTLLTTKLRLVLSSLADISTLSLGARLAQRLVHMADGYGDLRVGTSRVVLVNQEQLAAMLWASRQTVNRVLKTLEGSGLIRVSYGEIEILDLEGLKKESCARAD
ncbi:MAG TPA: Crp/Fnr family transcriptional regulator [Polyangiaceae bacterium]